MTDRELEALLFPLTVSNQRQVLARPSSIPRQPGLYAWYFDEPPPGVPTDGCHVSEHGTLLYIGISPSAPPTNGKPPSRQNLYKRIRYHYTGNAAGSALRLTLGCHLADVLGIELRRVGSGARLTFTPSGEAALSEWMSRHARVAVVEHDAPWLVEPTVIASAQTPLNIDHNATHPYYGANRALRAQHRATARSSPIWTPQ